MCGLFEKTAFFEGLKKAQRKSGCEGLEGLPSGKGFGKGNIVNIIQVPAGWKASGKPGDSCHLIFKFMLEKQSRRFSLDCGVGGKNQFFDLLLLDALLELGNGQLFRTDSVQG